MDNVKQATPGENDVHTYRRIRKAIGLLGVFLPIVLCTLSVIPLFKTQVQGSISHYYYTNLRELFTGVLCAVGLFLIRYKGHENKNFWKHDSRLTNIAGGMAFGVALVPTNPNACTEKMYTLFPFCEHWMGWVHYGFAATFFFVLSIIALNVFTIGQEKNENISMSVLNENNIYKACGSLMLLFLVLTPVVGYFEWFPYSTLIFEALMLFAFGTAWLIKGRALGDKGVIGRMLYREAN